MASNHATRIVVVNMNPRGVVHESTCRWLLGVGNAGGLVRTNYIHMRADHVPVNKRHCSHC